jgi:hypothetical protein
MDLLYPRREVLSPPGKLVEDFAMNDNARRRLAQKTARTKEAEEQIALQRFVAGLDPEYLTKLRVDCIRTANEQLRGASPEQVVAEAARHFESRVRFLMGVAP